MSIWEDHSFSDRLENILEDVSEGDCSPSTACCIILEMIDNLVIAECVVKKAVASPTSD
jgi:hypothetical protein